MKRILEGALLALVRRLMGRWKGPLPPFERILAVVVAGIGDTLLATPAVLALRKRYPEARIVLLINRRAGELLEGWDAVDSIVSLDIDYLLYSKRRGWYRPRGLAHIWRVWRELRRERFDLAVNLMEIASSRGSLLMGLWLKAVGASYRAGRDLDGRAAAFHLRTPERRDDGRHVVIKNMAVAEALGCPPERGPMRIPITEGDLLSAEEFLSARGVPEGLLIALHPWVRDEDRQWPAASWARVIEGLAARIKGTIVVLGGPQDHEATERLLRGAPDGSVVNAAGALSARATAALIGRCDIFLGALSGPLHMAASAGTPTVACYPHVYVEEYAPYTDPSRYRILTPEHLDAPLAEIPPEAVVEAVFELLGRERTDPPREVLHFFMEKAEEPSARLASVAHVITRLDRGGSSDYTILAALGLDKNRWKVTLVSGLTTEPSPLVRRLMERPDVELLFVPSLLRAMRPLKDIKALFDLWLLFRRKRFDLIHTHSSKAGILGRWAAYLAGCRHLVHTPHGHVFEGYYGPALSRLFVAAERLTAKITDAIVTLTPKGIDDHLAWGIAPREKFTVISDGVELEGFKPGGARMSRASLGLPPGVGAVVGSAGRLEPVKGYDLLVEASALVLKKMPDVWFVVAGDGQEREALKEQARRLGVSERWRFLGWRESLEEVYNAFDLSVLPSRMEGLGRAAVEAMACGLPVVATGVGGLPWVVEDGVTGLIVPPGEPRALADAIVRLLDDEGARKEMGAAGVRRARQLFSLQAMVESHERLYGRLLAYQRGSKP